MGLFRKLLFFLGLILIALPFLPFHLVPEGSIVGIDLLNNNVLLVVIGILLLILVFWSWKSERKKILLEGNFAGPRGPGNAQIMGKPIDTNLKRMQDIQRLKALQGAQ
jgi:hypothetical protein